MLISREIGMLKEIGRLRYYFTPSFICSLLDYRLVITLILILLIIFIIINCKYNACRCNNIKGDDCNMGNRINIKDVVNHDLKIKQLTISKEIVHGEKNNNDLKINSIEQTSESIEDNIKNDIGERRKESNQLIVISPQHNIMSRRFIKINILLSDYHG